LIQPGLTGQKKCMDKIPCSIAILTLNSAKTLRRCLESVKDFSDVYIFDGNSTDHTLAIAREFNIPVYKQYNTDEKNVRIKNFTEIRIKTDTLLKHDWTFLLDSDEYVSPELVDDVRRIISSSQDVKTAYFAVKKMVMGDKIIEYTFNDFASVMRLYNKQSGIAWKKSKVVHEQLYIPENVKIINLNSACYSHCTPSYRVAVQKDNYYLSLMHQKMFVTARSKKSVKLTVISIIKNLLRAANIFYKSIKMYYKYGFKETMPVRHTWRYIRYHLILSYYRLKELFI